MSMEEKITRLAENLLQKDIDEVVERIEALSASVGL